MTETVACDVCLWGEDDVENDFCVDTRPRARKTWTCCECREAIPPGTQYVRTVGKTSGDDTVWRYTTCLACADVRGVFYCKPEAMGYYFGSLWGDMREQAFEHLTTASPCFTLLTVAGRTKVMDEWRRWKGLT